MNLRQLRDGLVILTPYYDQPDGYHVGAEHDILYIYATDRPLSDEDAAKMFELGWFQENSEEGKYNPEDGWASYT